MSASGPCNCWFSFSKFSILLFTYLFSFSSFNAILLYYISFQIIQASKSDSRLANNYLPLDIQKLRCRACYEALRFAPRIEAMGKVISPKCSSDFWCGVALSQLYPMQ